MRKILIVSIGLIIFWVGSLKAEEQKILNASYDISREVYVDINKAFIPHYKQETGIDLTIDQSHAGSSKQARSILEGLAADVVTFNQVIDIDMLAKGGFVDQNWQEKFPNNASPYYSFPSFLVRAGNPKNIKNWDDLVRDDVKVIFPNPKTSGNARYTYLAAYAFALEKYGNDDNAKEFVKKLFSNVPVFDTGGRAATTTFIDRNIGDVLITFEAETLTIARAFGKDQTQIITPEVSLLAEFPVAVVKRVADKRGTMQTAEAYLKFLYTQQGQTILAQNGFRVDDAKVAAEYANNFPHIRLLTVNEVFGSWEQIQKEHFSSSGILNQLYEKR